MAEVPKEEVNDSEFFARSYQLAFDYLLVVSNHLKPYVNLHGSVKIVLGLCGGVVRRVRPMITWKLGS